MVRKERLEQQLSKEYSPTYLSVEDESGNHHVPLGAQTHFKIIIVSSRFNGLTRIARHRLVNELLKDEFEQGLHALSMHLYTNSEWEIKGQAVAQSPNCKDGYKNKNIL